VRQIIGLLGPTGTFSDQALQSQADLREDERKYFSSIPDILEAVELGSVNLGFVPLENSIEGIVNFTQDALVFDHDLLIQREVVLDVEHCVVGTPGTRLDEVNVLYSIPIAAAQCHTYIRKSLVDARILDASSTAEAARLAAEASDIRVAALASRSAAKNYGLAVLAEDVADHRDNQTRFVLVGKYSIPAKTGNDKTGLVVFQRADEPGSLISILQEFAARRINLSNLLSRPTKRGGLGDYCFIMYADGHIEDELVADALRELHAKQGSVKFLGSYPAAGVHAHSAREHADARWREADDWVGELRSRISR
jgi:prephenate dehydratase